jgi:hypothetical protein
VQPTKVELKSPKVFISYSHDSTEHEKRVFQLAKALRDHGINIELDQYHIRPPYGWSRWCEEQLRHTASDFVLMICTEKYLARVENRVPADEGRGVFWEGSIIYSYVYEEKENHRFIPILLSCSKDCHIPRPLRDHTRYRLTTFSFDCPGYEALYRELTGQPAVTKSPLGEVVRLSLVLMPALPTREVKSIFNSPPSLAADSHLPSGHQGQSNTALSGKPITRGIKKLSQRIAILAIVIVPMFWFFYGNESGKVWRKAGYRHFRDVYSEIGQQTPQSERAKLERHLAWIKSDFAESPITVLDTLDRCVFRWANQTTGATNTLNVVIPYFDQYTLLTNLSIPTQDFRSEWRVSDNSSDAMIHAMLQHGNDLKQIGMTASHRSAWIELPAMLLQPFSDIFRKAAVTTTNLAAPTSDELFSFVNGVCKTLEGAESIRILGYVRDESSWLVLCELQSSGSMSSVLVIAHPEWKPKAGIAFFEGKFIRFNPAEWKSDFEVVMPPSAWDIDAAWSFLK